MFRALYGMMAGQHSEIDARRVDSAIVFEATCACTHESGYHLEGTRCTASGCSCPQFRPQAHDCTGAFVSEERPLNQDDPSQWMRGSKTPPVAPAATQAVVDELRALVQHSVSTSGPPNPKRP